MAGGRKANTPSRFKKLVLRQWKDCFFINISLEKSKMTCIYVLEKILVKLKARGAASVQNSQFFFYKRKQLCNRRVIIESEIIQILFKKGAQIALDRYM